MENNKLINNSIFILRQYTDCSTLWASRNVLPLKFRVDDLATKYTSDVTLDIFRIIGVADVPTIF